MMIAMVIASVIAMRVAFPLIMAGSKAGLFGWPQVVWGWVILGVAMAYSLVVMGFAIDYMTHYNGLFMPITALVLGAASITALIVTGLKAMANQGGTLEDVKFFSKFVKPAFSSVGMTAAMTGAQTALQAGADADARAQNKSKKE